ncbi:uncharacterized protein N7503_007232 [Penicillium pulvis]|uniref:uncharacterized protein n=1 Tax=Penicillium pulvis TaxID=1562058 RepID=UPI002548B4EB|nr:uncharacterized protein N7503_007232 [Penicillium pulvis]KAJ5797936.1 hypothetical protein N7503_007232 [Penicillium pulvis]
MLHGDLILWGVFTFYAFHPFSESMSGESIDWEAFQRAVFLLSMRGVDRLGVMNDEILYTKDWSTIYVSNFTRVFRSISIWRARDEKPSDHKHAYKESMEEITNVLAMVQPYQELRPPREDWLKETASRLLGPVTKVQGLPLIEDLTKLMRLLLQLKVHERRRRTRFQPSAIYSFDPIQDDLADKVTEQFGRPQEKLTHNIISKVMKEFVCTSSFDDTKPLINDTSSHLIGALLLLLPYKTISKWLEIEDKDRQLIVRKLHFWTKADDREDTLNDFTSTSLARVLDYNSSPIIILITGKDTKTSKTGAMGVYLPSSESPSSKKAYEYVFFTLQPRFRAKRWTGIEKNLDGIINTQMERYSVGHISNEQTVGSKRPFWLGNPEKVETYMSFDPIQSIASFIISECQKSHDNDEVAGDVAFPHPPSDASEILFDAVKVFQVGVIDPVSPFSATGNEHEESNDKTKKATEVIRGEELKRRIQGFGPDSLPKGLQ